MDTQIKLYDDNENEHIADVYVSYSIIHGELEIRGVHFIGGSLPDGVDKAELKQHLCPSEIAEILKEKCQWDRLDV